MEPQSHAFHQLILETPLDQTILDGLVQATPTLPIPENAMKLVGLLVILKPGAPPRQDLPYHTLREAGRQLLIEGMKDQSFVPFSLTNLRVLDQDQILRFHQDQFERETHQAFVEMLTRMEAEASDDSENEESAAALQARLANLEVTTTQDGCPCFE